MSAVLTPIQLGVGMAAECYNDNVGVVSLGNLACADNKSFGC
jgi:hypothetical protein